MDPDSYLKFLEKLISTKQLKEKTKLGHFLNNIEVKSKYISKKKIKEEFITIAVELENKKKLLIEDLPINFLLSHSIFIGDETKLFEAQNNKDNKTYILDEKLLDTYKEYFNKNSIKEMSPKELFNKKYLLNFAQPTILEELKKYTLQTKKIELDNIHIVKGEGINNFLPTIKANHFRLATTMGLPLLRPLISDYFIKESNLNIKDNNSLKKQFNIIFLREKIIEWEFHKKTNEKLYHDVSTQLVISPDKDYLVQKIESLEDTYPSKEKLNKIILNANEIIVSQNKGKIPLPLWKSHRDQNFIPIKNTEEFLELTGTKFKLESKFFEDLYIQSLNGDIGIYSSLFLREDFHKYIDEKYEQDILLFENDEDLIIKLIQQKSFSIIMKQDKLEQTHLIQFKKKLHFLLKILIKSSIQENKIPDEIEDSLLSSYFLECCKKNQTLLHTYSKYPSQKILLKNSLKILNEVVLSTKKIGFSIQDHNALSNYFYSTINLHSFIDKDISKELKELFLSYFHTFKPIEINNIKENEKVNNLIKDLIELKNISKQEDTYVIGSKEIKKYLPDSTHYFNEKLDFKEFVVPNSKKIKETFPYNFKEVLSKIRKLDSKEKNKKIFLKGKEIEIKPEYYSTYRDYKNYSLIQKNSLYSLYRVRSSN